MSIDRLRCAVEAGTSPVCLFKDEFSYVAFTEFVSACSRTHTFEKRERDGIVIISFKAKPKPNPFVLDLMEMMLREKNVHVYGDEVDAVSNMQLLNDAADYFNEVQKDYKAVINVSQSSPKRLVVEMKKMINI